MRDFMDGKFNTAWYFRVLDKKTAKRVYYPDHNYIMSEYRRRGIHPP